MTFKGMLNFAFATLLVAGSSSAFAQDKVVTLSNKTAISWAEFVNAINDPSKVTGIVPENAEVRTNLAKANAAWEAAKTFAKLKGDTLTMAQNILNAKDVELAGWKEQKSANVDLLSGISTQLSTLSTKRTPLKDRQDSIEKAITSLDKKPVYTPKPWIKTIITKAKAFQTAFDACMRTSGKYTSVSSVYYKFEKVGRTSTLYLAFGTQPDATFTSVNELDFILKFIDDETNNKAKSVYVYLGSEYKDATDGYFKIESFLSNTANEDAIGLAVTAIVTLAEKSYSDINYEIIDTAKETQLKEMLVDAKAKVAAVDAEIAGVNAQSTKIQAQNDSLQTLINGYILPAATSVQAGLKAAVAAAQAKKEAADAAVVEAKSAVDDAKSALAQAQATADANAMSVYKKVNLTADITVDTPMDHYDGTIFGNNHIITVSTGAGAMFETFTGILAGAAVNGKIAKTMAGAACSDVAAWSGVGTYYNDNGVKTENIGTLGELGFLARNTYGVNFNANKLVAKTDASTVYSVTVYEPKSETKSYVLKSGNSLVDAKGTFTLPVNRFAKSETYDLTGIDNVFLPDNTCEKVVITDRKSFYCPVDLNVATVSYPRAFTAGKNAVCLPFELTSALSEKITYRSTYHNETAEKFWFKIIEDNIDAYKPALIGVSEAFTLGDIYNVVVKATPAEMVTVDEGDPETADKSYGLLKNCSREEFAPGPEKAAKIFGLTTAGTFKSAGDNAVFPAFRLVVESAQEVTGTSRAGGFIDEKGIGFIDDRGTTVIEDVNSDALVVEGKNGEIVISSPANCDNVAIYTVDGRVATVTDVKAGVNNVAVPSGVYIVMGKKVMVK